MIHLCLESFRSIWKITCPKYQGTMLTNLMTDGDTLTPSTLFIMYSAATMALDFPTSFILI